MEKRKLTADFDFDLDFKKTYQKQTRLKLMTLGPKRLKVIACTQRCRLSGSQSVSVSVFFFGGDGDTDCDNDCYHNVLGNIRLPCETTGPSLTIQGNLGFNYSIRNILPSIAFRPEFRITYLKYVDAALRGN
jgi:hypothetical protein